MAFGLQYFGVPCQGLKENGEECCGFTYRFMLKLVLEPVIIMVPSYICSAAKKRL
jgi:hypothetical protein